MGVPEPVDRERLESAREAARAAAASAEVRIVPLSGPHEVRRLLPVVDAIWGEGVSVSPELLRALAHAGAVLLAAEPLDHPDNSVGFAFGFLGWAGGLHLHSHQVGVLPERQGTGVGYALKLTQRAVCLENGITEMRWTFDPLLARNAAFNFGRLGVLAVAFCPDFYGEMRDEINQGDASDRFEVSWPLDRPIEPRRPNIPSHPTELVAVDHRGRPHRTQARPTDMSRVAIPNDYHALRRSGSDLALAWRQASRTAFYDCFDAGLAAVAFDRQGYLFVKGH